MDRKILWRHAVSDAVHLHQNQALSTTIFILKEFGPTGFLLKEEGESKKFKVCIGNPHTCTCSTFIKENDLCKHICWVLIRKFRLPRDHEYCFQLGLVDRQISELVQDLHPLRNTGPDETPLPLLFEEDGCVRQKEIEAEDVCPICQEDLMGKKLPVSYCRYGCGNNVHISCMKVWADHQPPLDLDAMVKCPLCREAFEPMKLLLDQVKYSANLLTTAERERSDKHLGIICNNCKVCPITGKCFKCIVCSYYHLCEVCFNGHCHPQHHFAFRTKRTQRWLSLRMCSTQKTGETREWVPESAEVQSSTTIKCDNVPKEIVRTFLPVEVKHGSKLLKPGQQCRLCLKTFNLGQRIKHLPCHHKFHAECADPWLLQFNSCPLDGHAIYNPLTWPKKGKLIATKHAKISTAFHQQAFIDKIRKEMFVPGLGLNLTKTARGTSSGPLVTRQKTSAGNRMLGLHIGNEPRERYGGASGSAEPHTDAGPSRSDARSVPQADSHLTDPVRREMDRIRSSARARGQAKRNVKRVVGASLPVGNERPEHSLSVGLSGLEIQVHTREVGNLGRTRPLRTRSEPQPIPVTVREKSPESPSGSTQDESE